MLKIFKKSFKIVFKSCNSQLQSKLRTIEKNLLEVKILYFQSQCFLQKPQFLVNFQSDFSQNVENIQEMFFTETAIFGQFSKQFFLKFENLQENFFNCF